MCWGVEVHACVHAIHLDQNGHLAPPSAILTREPRNIKCAQEQKDEERSETLTHFTDRQGDAEVVANLLFFLRFRLWNNERTEQIQFLRYKRGPLALTVPESLGPKQRFLSRTPYTATSTTAQFSGSSQAAAPA